MQRLIETIYPPQCVICEAHTDIDFALCGACWGETPFIRGLCCNGCGAPLPGEGDADGGILCDDCMVIARPWSRGRSVMVYKDKARKFVLALKHGDRTDLSCTAGPWLVRTVTPLMKPDSVVVPVPLHRFRLLRRKYNQAALLAQQVAKVSSIEIVPDALERLRQTAPLEGHTRDERFKALSGAISVNPKQAEAIKGCDIILVDDVMTSGATFAACTEALYAAGAHDVCVLALARVVKDA